jgi:enoyl-CoA hydratase/carnithine racemase
MSDGTVHYQAEDGIALITLDRPAKRNALSDSMCTQLHAAWTRFRDSDTERVAILTGAGDVFTAGADVNTPFAHFFDAFPEVGVKLDKPVIAAVAGPVVGGGVSMVAMCDLCVAADTTRFIYPEAQLGLTVGLIAALVARIPHKVAMEVMLLGGALDAARAYEIGFVNRVVPAGEQLRVAREMALGLAAAAPMVITALKRFVRDTLPRSPAERAQEARREIDQVFASADSKEGMAAFHEKRKPVFRGQ